MKYQAPSHLTRLLNVSMRLASLGTKMILTLYIARYMQLTSMGYYGLVTGTVFILMVVLGLRLDYIVGRELVGKTPHAALAMIRDQAVFYLFNQALLAIAMIVFYFAGFSKVNTDTLIFIFILSVLENWGDTIFVNLIALGRPLVANFVFFMRTAFWVIPVIAFGLLWPDFRNINFVFESWVVGSAFSICIALFAWRKMPWSKVMRTPIDWAWIKKSSKICFLIWLGSLGGSMGYYLDRFVLDHNMTRDIVGIATFYSSFGSSLFALIHSGVLSFAYPHLIDLHKKNDVKGFFAEVRKVAVHVAVLAAILGLGIAIVVPLAGTYFGRPEFAKYAPTLWLIVFATWIRCNSETLYYILFARGQDTALWVGALLYLIPSLGCNLVLVPHIGLEGIGYSAVISSLMIFFWRGWHVYHTKTSKNVMEDIRLSE